MNILKEFQYTREKYNIVEHLAERILFLKGEVEMKASAEVKKVHDIKAMLELACKMEEGAILDYNKFANECATNAHSVSKKIFEDLVVDEEGHFDQFYTELDNISKNSFVFLRPKW